MAGDDFRCLVLSETEEVCVAMVLPQGLKKCDGIISQTLEQAPDAERKKTVFFF